MTSDKWLSVFGLFLALLGPLALLSIVRKTNQNTFSVSTRLSLWGIMFSLLALTLFGERKSFASIGFKTISIDTLVVGVITLFAVMAFFALSENISAYFGLPLSRDEKAGSRVTSLSLPVKIFICVTAGVVEEILFRGYAISHLDMFFNNIWLAGFISLIFFVLNHFGWTAKHLVNVFFVGAILTVSFILSKDIVACIFAHAAGDLVGFVALPALLAKRKAQA